MKFISVQPDSFAHQVVLFALLGRRRKEENISHKGMPTWAEHKAFVLSNPYPAWYLIVSDDDDDDDEDAAEAERQYYGAIYLTHQREVGIFFFDDHQGKGYGKVAMQMLMRMHPGRILANIAPGNHRSQRFFEGLGFKPIQLTYEGGHP